MKVLLFGGTSEGRRIAEAFVSGRKKTGTVKSMHICVASDYGAGLLPEDDELIIHHKRMDEEEMEELIRREGFDVCVDATHPYARIVSGNIRAACEAAGLKLYRVARDELSDKKDISYEEGIIRFDFLSDAVSYINGSDIRNIFITTGSKNLEEYTAISDYANRCYVRVLPSAEAINRCTGLKFKPAHIICMQGPFDRDLNLAMFKACGVDAVVTKESGQEGGYYEKLEAARELGISCLVIGRPSEDKEETFTLKDIFNILGLEEKKRKKAYLIGTGCGEGNLTMKALRALSGCDHIIGAGRMIDGLGALDRSRIGDKKLFVSYDKDEIDRYLKDNEPDEVALLYSGDIGFYSGAAGIVDRLDEYEIVTIPGISSGVYLCDRLMIPWQDVRFLSCHGRELDLKEELVNHNKLLILLGREKDAADICRCLCDSGHEAACVYIGENLGYKDERIRSGRAADYTNIRTSSLAVILVDIWEK